MSTGWNGLTSKFRETARSELVETSVSLTIGVVYKLLSDVQYCRALGLYLQTMVGDTIVLVRAYRGHQTNGSKACAHSKRALRRVPSHHTRIA